jgi:type IV pilus secretin PilQ/predicted competence protein
MRQKCDSAKRSRRGSGKPASGLRATMCMIALAASAGICAAQQEAPKPVNTGFARTSPNDPECKGMDTVVSVRVNDMDLAQALRLLHDASGISFAMSGEVKGKVTCSIKDKSARTVLNAFLEPNGYDYVERDGVVVVQKAGAGPKPEGAAAGIQQGKIIRRSFTIPYMGYEVLSDVVGGIEEGSGGGSSGSTSQAPPAAKPMDQVIREMLSPAGKMVFYERQHLIIIEDYEQVVQNIADLVEQLWAVPAQIFIDAKLLEVELDNDSALGLQWQAVQAPALRSNFNTGSTTTVLTTAPGLLTGNPGTAMASLSPIVPTFANETAPFSFGISNKHIDVVLSAIAARARVDTRSNPRLLVVNHRKATIVAGEEVPYLTSVQSTGAEPIQTYSFKEVAVHLEVTPHASDDGMVFLDVHPTVKNVIGYTGSPAQPVLSVREASTSVVMQDGTTLIIGGLLKRDINKQWQEVPFLARIPLIGWLFQQKSDSDTKNDLIFLINPRILTPKLMKELAKQNNAARLHEDIDPRNNLRVPEPPEHVGESSADKPKW